MEKLGPFDFIEMPKPVLVKLDDLRQLIHEAIDNADFDTALIIFNLRSSLMTQWRSNFEPLTVYVTCVSCLSDDIDILGAHRVGASYYCCRCHENEFIPGLTDSSDPEEELIA